MTNDSRLLIVDQMLDDPPSLIPAIMNAGMLNIGARERTLNGFKKILEGTGLQILKVYRSPASLDAIVECAKIQTVN